MFFLEYLVISTHALVHNFCLWVFFSRSTFDNLELLKDGVYGALVTAAIIGVHEIAHILAARDTGIKLAVPYFVPSWQVSFPFFFKSTISL